MTLRSYRRLTRYAALALLHLVVVIAVLAGPVQPAHAGLVVLVASVALVWAWGAFQADIAVNAWLDDLDRARWRIALWLLPWSMALYWRLHVRPRRALD